VIGGYEPSDLQPIREVEAIDLANVNHNCPSLPNYPLDIYLHTAAFYQDQVVICGGGEPKVDSCYSLGRSLDEWRPMQTLLGGADSDLKSSVLGNKWFISGGENNANLLRVYQDGVFVDGITMPFPKEAHCQLTINATHIFFTAETAETFLYNVPKDEFVRLEPIPEEVAHAAC